MQQAKFSIGQIVHHRLFDYRGVIFDVDCQFMGSDDWYEQVALSRPPKHKPWYRVLVDNAIHQTYVAERNLEASRVLTPIHNPLIDVYFSGMRNDHYILRHRNN